MSDWLAAAATNEWGRAFLIAGQFAQTAVFLAAFAMLLAFVWWLFQVQTVPDWSVLDAFRIVFIILGVFLLVGGGIALLRLLKQAQN
jgi:hypothetical protein